MDYDLIDEDRLREDLIDYFGSATPVEPFAYATLLRVEQAILSELIYIATSNGFDISDYYENGYER